VSLLGLISLLTIVAGVVNAVEAFVLCRVTVAHVALWVLTLLWLLELAYRIGQRGA